YFDVAENFLDMLCIPAQLLHGFYVTLERFPPRRAIKDRAAILRVGYIAFSHDMRRRAQKAADILKMRYRPDLLITVIARHIDAVLKPVAVQGCRKAFAVYRHGAGRAEAKICRGRVGIGSKPVQR